ncbi:MAG: transglutaminase family protein [Sphaerochaeta sp.]|jgi:transglutaminase-like putative cysteine protease|nr:transglutaminase family protein [Sphaerochaeta sp.]
MDPSVVPIDDQPISSTFFGEGRWLTDFVTPDEPDVQLLWADITDRINSTEDRIIAAWDWVANEVHYKPFISATLSVEGKTSVQKDYWQSPAVCSLTKVGNCANKSFLLASLLRNELSPQQVHCVLGNLLNGKYAGHAWVEINLNGKEYVVEATRNDVPLLETRKADRYQPVHYFNDQEVYAVPGRTVLTPFQKCYSTWLRDYLNWNYIHGGR